MSRKSYQEQIIEFAQRFQSIKSVYIKYLKGASSITGHWMEADRPCELCGSEKPKYLYALLCDGQLYLVGQNCYKQIEKMPNFHYSDKLIEFRKGVE